MFPRLKKDINTALKPFPDFREELFDKLYTFFQRYFSESGSIYFRYTSLHQNIYEKVYTDDRDVILFWKTHMLYYVKTDRIFTSLNIEIDGVKFFFDAGKIVLKKANEKRETVYAFRKVEEDGRLVFDVTYSEKGKSTKVDDILKAVKLAGQKLSDETLAQALRIFEKQSEVDYFINKDARAFLQEQFDLWLYQYLFSGQNVWSAERLAQLQVLKAIAWKVIDFISQFEDELVRIWNKPKFVRNSHYIITLDKITDPHLLERIFAHANMAAQLDEWRNLGMIDEKFSLALLDEKDVVGEPRHPQYQYLPLDTRYFPDLELDILALFDDQDAALDGWLVHSENYQALNTLLPKFKERVDVVYIDPPFNTAASEIIYQNQYKHSSWLALIDDRIRKVKSFMKDSSIICTAIDDFEAANIDHCLSNIFDEENRLATVVVRNNPHGRAMAAGFSQNHEFAFFYGKTKKATVGRLPRGEKQKARYPEKDSISNFAWMNFRATGANSRRADRPKLYYPIFISKEGVIRISEMQWSNEHWEPEETQKADETVSYPIDDEGSERVWNLGWERAKEELQAILQSKLIDGKWQIYRKYRPNEDGMLPATWWDNAKYSATESGTKIIKDLFGERELFSYPKSVFLEEDCLRAANCAPTALTLDFFAGSGTTAQAVMNLNRDGGHRKYILVEMGEHFNTVILPRIKKVAFHSKWKDAKPVFEKGEGGLSQFVKYYELEQYEEVLRRARYADADLFDNPYGDPYHQYVFLRDLKNLDVLEVDSGKNAVHFHPERLYPDIDLAETLSNLRGKWIKRITREYVEFQDGEQVSLTDPDWRLLKPLVWW